ncbi:protein kinase domain-containing protein [Nonomuraea aridisoli]|uniref:protein kinase domain-containing protein n=1 Tax=Nonomuraea aridisoli TaxID=2070368 RepID=UPI0011B935C7|nr:protein kinase [Nonomuraea aridisoli]
MSVLGEGGQGTVYLGEAPGGLRVAIKVLHRKLAADPETRRRFLREAEVAARVAAFCTARIIGTGLVGEQPYIVSEYVPGPSLDELVKRDGPRRGSGLERLAVSTLTALASIHAAGVVHRDFKPANVILGPEGPVVIDFGIARAFDHVTTNTQVTGTPSYMSPEQFANRPLTPASDMFSWAGSMVFAATGHSAFPGSAIPVILHGILNGEPKVSGVPEPLRPLVLACLAKDPAVRPSADQVLRALTGGGPLPRPYNQHEITNASGRSRRRRSKGAVLAVAAGGAALLVTAGVLVVPSWLSGRETPALAQGNQPSAAQPSPPAVAMPLSSSVAKPLKSPSTKPSRSPSVKPSRSPSTKPSRSASAKPSRSSSVQPVQPESPSARVRPGATLDLGALPVVALDDRFAGGASGGYVTYQPFSGEDLPDVTVGNGRFRGTGTEPYFGLMAGGRALASDQAVSVVTIGSFAETGKQEDSVFVGWIKDDSDYATAWYNNTRGTTGFDVRVNGEFLDVADQIPATLQPGDRLAVLLTGETLTSYAEHAGTWRRLYTTSIAGALTTAEVRSRFRYGFGLRATTGTITVTGMEGRSARP